MYHKYCDMNRIRTTFTRSRTPTGAEMKMQSSLEVQRQVRSTSFDEFQLEKNRTAAEFIDCRLSTDESSALLLQVPQSKIGAQRSRSVESGSTDTSSYLEVPKRFQLRRSSSMKSPVSCVHCLCVEKYEREKNNFNEDTQLSDTSFSDDNDTDESEYIEKCDERHLTIPMTSPNCGIKFSISPIDSFHLQSAQYAQCSSSSIENQYDASTPTIDIQIPIQSPTRARRRSISRQEAIFIEPTGSSLENLVSVNPPTENKRQIKRNNDQLNKGKDSKEYVQELYLTVPDTDLRRDRAASVDSSFSKMSSNGKTEELQTKFDGFLSVPTNATRSHSVDIVLPTNEQARYKALALAGPSISKRIETSRRISQSPDWSDDALACDHLWMSTSISGDFCCTGDSDCLKHGARMKCSACKVIAHTICIPIIMNRAQLLCKPSFRDVNLRQYREQRSIHHHWIHRRTEKGKCKQCGKSIQAKLSFSSKEIVAISCAWCKYSYHNRDSCFNIERIGEECHLGIHGNIIVPPSWIIKLPRKGSFKSSLRKTPKMRDTSHKKSKDKDAKAFMIKPIPSTKVTPVLVFINPKSGGNQGVKLLQKFQWLLNPRQVFDLTQGGPKMGLELFRKVPHLKILACGGDGTAGWVLSVLDQLHFENQPAVGVLPLGTGNDLARALGWGGGYTDEPIGKILTNIGNSDTILLDRWSLKVTPNDDVDDDKHNGKDNLPLNVVNNYFSFGVDAHIALEFHEAREAHPERFNSRLRNKMFYGQAGGKDLLKRKWKDLSEMVTLECDGKDLTAKLKEHRVHAIVFLNIPSYGGGTHPWNNSGAKYKQATDDGLIEVVGLTTYQLPLLQAGGHGTSITQCKTAKIVTSKTIPMQVDGEAARLKPSIIELGLLNQALMLAKKKPGRVNVSQSNFEPIPITIYKISMTDYETHHYDKDLLRQSATILASLKLNPDLDLESIRRSIEHYCEENPNTKLNSDWCYLDSCTAERFFRVDRAQENLHFLTDIATDSIFILDQELMILPQTPEDDKANGRLLSRKTNFSSGSSDNLEKESHENTPTSPIVTQQFFESRELHIPSPSPKPIERFREDIPPISLERTAKFKSNLLEKTSDAVIKTAKTGNFIMLRDLHLQGYSLLSIDATGQTALHYACKFGHKDIVKFLISYAPNSIINMIDNTTGQTALHKAVQKMHKSICYMLVAAGANLKIRDTKGRTAMMLAFEIDDNDLASYLESQEKMLRAEFVESI